MTARQCIRQSKRTHQRCGGRAMRGQEVCYQHGGASPQAKAKAAERIALAEALATSPRRHPGEVLLDAVHTADVLAAQARAEITADGQPTRKTMRALIDATTRQGALARAALSAEAESRVAKFSEQQANRLRVVFGAFLREVGLAGDRDARAAMGRVLDAVESGDVAALRDGFSAYSQPFNHRDGETMVAVIRWLLTALGMSASDPWVMSTMAVALRATSAADPHHALANMPLTEPPLGWWEQLLRRARQEVERRTGGRSAPTALPSVEVLPALPVGGRDV